MGHTQVLLPFALCFIFCFLKTVIYLFIFYGECRGDESGHRYGNEIVM